MLGRPRLSGRAGTALARITGASGAMIRLCGNDEPEIFVPVVLLVTGREMQANGGYHRDSDEHGRQHQGDDPGGARGGARRRFRDAHGADEGVRQKEEELHGHS